MPETLISFNDKTLSLVETKFKTDCGGITVHTARDDNEAVYYFVSVHNLSTFLNFSDFCPDQKDAHFILANTELADDTIITVPTGLKSFIITPKKGSIQAVRGEHTRQAKFENFGTIILNNNALRIIRTDDNAANTGTNPLPFKHTIRVAFDDKQPKTTLAYIYYMITLAEKCQLMDFSGFRNNRAGANFVLDTQVDHMAIIKLPTHLTNYRIDYNPGVQIRILMSTPMTVLKPWYIQSKEKRKHDHILPQRISGVALGSSAAAAAAAAGLVTTTSRKRAKLETPESRWHKKIDQLNTTDPDSWSTFWPGEKTPLPYQADIFKEFDRSLQARTRHSVWPLVVGAGKTFMFNSVIAVTRWDTIILTSKANLVDQTKAELQDTYGGLVEVENLATTDFFKKGRTPKENSPRKPRVAVGTYAWIRRNDCNNAKAIDFSQVDMVVLDEVHQFLSDKSVSVVNSIMKFENTHVLAFSGTPYVLEKKEASAGVSSAYQLLKIAPESNPISGISLAKGVETGISCPISSIIIRPELDGSLRLRKRGGDYLSKDLDKLKNDKLNNLIAHLYLNTVDHETNLRFLGRQGIVFACGVSHSDLLADALNRVPIDEVDPTLQYRNAYADCKKAQYIAAQKKEIEDSHLPFDEEKIASQWEEHHRESVMADFRVAVSIHSYLSKQECTKRETLFTEGGAFLAVGADKFIEGFNHPKTSLIFNVRPTLSTAMREQMVGRGSRRYEGKHLTVFDFAYVKPADDKNVYTYTLLSDNDETKFRAGIHIDDVIGRKREMPPQDEGSFDVGERYKYTVTREPQNHPIVIAQANPKSRQRVRAERVGQRPLTPDEEPIVHSLQEFIRSMDQLEQRFNLVEDKIKHADAAESAQGSSSAAAAAAAAAAAKPTTVTRRLLELDRPVYTRQMTASITKAQKKLRQINKFLRPRRQADYSPPLVGAGRDESPQGVVHRCVDEVTALYKLSTALIARIDRYMKASVIGNGESSASAAEEESVQSISAAFNELQKGVSALSSDLEGHEAAIAGIAVRKETKNASPNPKPSQNEGILQQQVIAQWRTKHGFNNLLSHWMESREWNLKEIHDALKVPVNGRAFIKGPHLDAILKEYMTILSPDLTQLQSLLEDVAVVRAKQLCYTHTIKTLIGAIEKNHEQSSRTLLHTLLKQYSEVLTSSDNLPEYPLALKIYLTRQTAMLNEPNAEGKTAIEVVVAKLERYCQDPTVRFNNDTTVKCHILLIMLLSFFGCTMSESVRAGLAKYGLSFTTTAAALGNLQHKAQPFIQSLLTDQGERNSPFMEFMRDTIPKKKFSELCFHANDFLEQKIISVTEYSDLTTLNLDRISLEYYVASRQHELNDEQAWRILLRRLVAQSEIIKTEYNPNSGVQVNYIHLIPRLEKFVRKLDFKNTSELPNDEKSHLVDLFATSTDKQSDQTIFLFLKHWSIAVLILALIPDVFEVTLPDQRQLYSHVLDALETTVSRYKQNVHDQTRYTLRQNRINISRLEDARDRLSASIRKSSLPPETREEIGKRLNASYDDFTTEFNNQQQALEAQETAKKAARQQAVEQTAASQASMTAAEQAASYPAAMAAAEQAASYPAAMAGAEPAASYQASMTAAEQAASYPAAMAAAEPAASYPASMTAAEQAASYPAAMAAAEPAASYPASMTAAAQAAAYPASMTAAAQAASYPAAMAAAEQAASYPASMAAAEPAAAYPASMTAAAQAASYPAAIAGAEQAAAHSAAMAAAQQAAAHSRVMASAIGARHRANLVASYTSPGRNANNFWYSSSGRGWTPIDSDLVALFQDGEGLADPAEQDYAFD